MNIWRINVRDQSFRREPLPETWAHLGGRGLLDRILLDEVPPTCDALGPSNKLIFAPGLLVGHMLSSCDRISIGGKSPLTGGIKESNGGGRTGLQLALLGIRGLIIEGAPAAGSGWWVLHLTAESAIFERAGDPALWGGRSLVGLGAYDTAPLLFERYGKKVAAALIGQGGEMRLSAAGILNVDNDGVPSRISARGGLGALMGSKGLKAIVIDGSTGQKPPLANPEAFRAARNAFTRALMGVPITATFHDYGTAANVHMVNNFGALPTRNFSAGQFEDAEEISGEHLRELILEREGEGDPSHNCMPGCAIHCSNVYAGTDGKAIVSPLEYETIGLMGSNLGISDLDTIGKLNRAANDLGLDSIELGAALGVAAEAGLMAFGDGTRALELVGEIYQGTPLGRVLGHGAGLTGKVFGVTRVPVVKNQAISAYDPRAIKGTGVTYATSPQGADHTAGLTLRAKVDHLKPEGQAALSRTVQINAAGYDTLGACSFAGAGLVAAPGAIRDLLNTRYGWQVGDDILQRLGREALALEREFNRRAGFTPADDRLPEWMTREPLAPTGAVFDVSTEDLDGVFNC
jgi:aldehyde:ferredoxin oxidoreductase